MVWRLGGSRNTDDGLDETYRQILASKCSNGAVGLVLGDQKDSS